MRKARKHRTRVSLSERVIRQIDEAVGPRKRSEFLEKAALAQLRKEAFKKWIRIGEKFKGLTLEDTHYPSKEELENRGGQASH